MAINLQKGGRIDLSKESTASVFRIGLDSPEAIAATGCIHHSGDNRTGAGDGDDETITIDTAKVPANVQEIVVLVNIHDAKNR